MIELAEPTRAAWGEFHVLFGVGLQLLAGHWEVAIVPAILSHWMLDDLNVGAVAMLYHGIGDGWRRVVTSILRIPIIGFIAWLFWQRPELMICGLTAWLVIDHEWAVGALLRRHGYGLHERMWRPWMYGEKGLLVWAGVYAFAIVLILCNLEVIKW